MRHSVKPFRAFPEYCNETSHIANANKNKNSAHHFNYV